MKKVLALLISIFVIALFADFTYAPAVIPANSNIVKGHVSKKVKNDTRYFKAMLNGKQVVPPVKTKAHGEATFDFSKNGKKVYYKVYVYKIDSVIMVHIHHAPAGKNGPIAVWLFKSKGTKMVNGFLTKGVITNKDVNLDSLRTWMDNGDAFVMVHTKAHPAGEIRGIIKQSINYKLKK